jgi:hypothetical protein
MIKSIVITLLLLMASATAGESERPLKKYKNIDYNYYFWLYKTKKYEVTIITDEVVENFISEDELQRYIKLRMKNFAHGVELGLEYEGYEYNYILLTIDLSKYNESSEIYTGLISFKAYPSATIPDQGLFNVYEIIYPIAGSDKQIRSFIKDSIDAMVESFAEDYFYIEELDKLKQNGTLTD